MVDTTLVQVGKNLSDAMRILEDGHSGQDVATILHLVHNLIHEEEEEEDKPSQHRMQNVGEQGHMALLGHSLAAYISVLERERLRKLTTRILSDTTLWLCRLFRYENGSAYFHEDDREGLVKVCRLVIHARYEEYASDGYAVLSSKQPVIYQSASGRPGLGQHLCSQLGLPLSSLCTVPCNTIFGSQHQMDVALLDKLIKEDVEAGKLPLLLIRQRRVNLATLALGQVTSTIMAANRSDSMTLTPGQWLGLPAVTAVTLYRHEDPALSLAAGLTSSQPVAKLRALPLWLSLQYLGHNGIVQKISHAAALSQQLLQKLKTLVSIKTSVEDELSSPVVLFKFSQEMSAASSGGSVEGFCAGEREVLDAFNRWLGEQLVQLVPTSGVDVVELEDEGTCVRFSPLLTAAVLGTQQQDVDDLVEKLSELVPVMSSTMCLRQDFREETHRHTPSLVYVDDLTWPGLGVVRYEPQDEGMDESRRKQELEKINTELLKKLQELDTDIIFSTGPEFGTEECCIFVGMVTEDVDVSELVDTIAALGRDIEESGRLPLVGSVLNWFSPVQSSIKGRTFNLAAGSLDSTEVTYSTKAQPGRPSLQDTPTSSSKRLPGQRLFQRSGAGSDSFSETSSIGQAEETPREGSTTPSCSIHPPISPPKPEEDSHSASDAVAEEIPELLTQAEAEETSEERQPEGQEVEESGR
ncbi:Pyridoxal-dependent decarboxylase domain-containing protein 1 [Nibea albiflora]|uniref:Pyridoxal-dependent decarboxylase domain-containing protein 1 n=1 Tax=Nibea albiflora TaxID=240163 RepID=A0ACB7EXJ9_NIBAL|nr:Pyridoxal-dependent decarboxylase domain-containing protein 1 [Nibea albiflora]